MDHPASESRTDILLNRIGRWIMVLTGVGTAAVLGSGRFSLAASFACGGAMSYLGFRTHRLLVDRAILGQRTRWMTAKVFLRYGLLLLLVYVMIRFSVFLAAGFLVGLLVAVPAIFIESLRFFYQHLTGREQ